MGAGARAAVARPESIAQYAITVSVSPGPALLRRLVRLIVTTAAAAGSRQGVHTCYVFMLVT